MKRRAFTIQWILLSLWAAILVAAFAFGKLTPDRTRYAVRPLLMVTSALLVVMAVLFWWQYRLITSLTSFSLLLALGMAASFIGDLIMAEYIPTPQRVIFGILAFGAAHLLYITGYLNIAQKLGLNIAWWAVGGGAIVLGIILWAVFARSSQVSAALNYSGLAYTLLICVMTCLAIAVGLGAPRLWPLPVGAILFLASDAILANQIFRKRNWFLVSDVIWLLYISGQALIVWSNLAFKTR